MKLNTKNIGNLGEDLSAKWFELKGYFILERNWRYKRSEVDIIASKENKLHFIEIKTRTNSNFGYPEESINQVKMNALKKAAVAYLELNTCWKEFQFDVLSVQLNKNKDHEFFLIEDVFF
ncbi:MAG TPA: YraN family protein [Chitinophagaceae bacterium]|nr:YraN family protein [Chitinophagaceae bacterium]MCC6634719.1 YraN family protein [Chitinophagaceae bacterium]HMZ45736.1 YraN family protein [Chitinophagaceae bacterium]HNF29607.1 YraN family protein [Chitinophagaceae bacterium]HNL82374.1 YraN family protein [Chitinophagaceae bacterium]